MTPKQAPPQAKASSLPALVLRLLRHPRFRRNNAPSLLLLCIFVLLLLSRLMDTALVQRDGKYLTVILLQMLIFLLPTLLYCRLAGKEFSSRLALRLPAPGQLLLLLGALLVMIAGGLLISIHTGGIESSRGNFSLYEVFVADTTASPAIIFYQLLAFAALPAFCEELVFRGVLLQSLAHRGAVCSIAFSALYFGMLHFDFAQLPVYLFAGVVLCLVVRVTRSLPAAMLVHFFYNVFGLFGQSVLARFYSYSGNDTMFRFLLTVVLLVGAILFCGQASNIYHRYALDSLPPPEHREPSLRALPAALVRTLFPVAGVLCILLYVVVTLWA